MEQIEVHPVAEDADESDVEEGAGPYIEMVRCGVPEWSGYARTAPDIAAGSL
jgi:hypothetical protein